MATFAILILVAAAPVAVHSNTLETVKSLPGVPPAALAAGNHFSGYPSRPPAINLPFVSIDSASLFVNPS